MYDEIYEKLKKNAPYIIVGIVAGYLLKSVIDEVVLGKNADIQEGEADVDEEDIKKACEEMVDRAKT